MSALLLALILPYFAVGQEATSPAAVAESTVPESTVIVTDPPALWGEWRDWQCGQSYVQERRRHCSEKPCQPGKPRIRKYYPSRCAHIPEPAYWDEWQAWSACSVTCGGGSRLRVRNCTWPAFEETDAAPVCAGDGHEEERCNTNPCPVDGEFLPWGEWGPCSKTCGDAVHTRSRGCSPPLHGGNNCSWANTTETEFCDDIICPGWKAWGEFSSCTKPCGGGEKRRERKCYQGGEVPAENCIGLHYQRWRCNRHPCPVNGQWGAWEDWKCLRFDPCEGRQGVRQRRRYCNNPAPAHGGQRCEGDAIQRERTCNGTCHRTVNGGWCSWFWNTNCKEKQFHFKMRNCACPPPMNGGDSCNNTETGERSNFQFDYSQNRTCDEGSDSGSGSGSGDGSGLGDGSNGDDDGEDGGDDADYPNV